MGQHCGRKRQSQAVVGGYGETYPERRNGGDCSPHGYELKLLSSAGTRQFDTNTIINRYDTRIAMTVLADFIFLGHDKTGSWALSSDKTQLFAVAIGAFLDIICETFNSQGIPALIDLNREHFAGIMEYPKMTHGDIEDVDITKVSAFIKDMVGIGVLIPDDGLEDYIRQAGHLPGKTYEMMREERKQQQESNQPQSPDHLAMLVQTLKETGDQMKRLTRQKTPGKETGI